MMEQQNIQLNLEQDIRYNKKMKKDLPLRDDLRKQKCIICETPMGDMPGSRDAYCPNCGYKDPCCE
jgi:hypothetical protein